ncbi:MAG: DUF4880 domain-containing protein, partial [Pseudomonadota bacterium]
MRTDPRVSADIAQAAHECLARMSHPDATNEERRAFEIWLAADLRHEEAYDRAITLWAALDTLERGDIDADLLEPRAQPTLW